LTSSCEAAIDASMAIGDDFVRRAVAATGGRMEAVVSAFGDLLRNSWPSAPALRLVDLAAGATSSQERCKQLLSAFDAVNAQYASASFWWKDEGSRFLGFCPRIAAASGVKDIELLGKNDADPAVVWSRQGPVYMRDDREVLKSGVPRFDIVERQDRHEGTVWLRTSKVPYSSAAGSGTVGGFDLISAEHAKELAKRRARP
jgi:hypothetical protein